MDRDDISLEVTCDCGHQFEITFGRLKQERQFTCPACGDTTTESEESIAAADARLAAITSPDVIKNIGEGVSKELRDAIKRAKR